MIKKYKIALGIYALAIVLSVLIPIIDDIIDFFINGSQGNFLRTIILDLTTGEKVLRLTVLMVFLSFAFVINRILINKDQILNNLAGSREEFRLTLEHMIAGFASFEIILDDNSHTVNFRYSNINSQFENLFHITRNKLLGRNTNDFCGECMNKIPDWFNLLSNDLKTKSAFKDRNFSFNDRYFNLSGYYVNENNFVIIVRDVTEQVKLTLKVNESENRLKTLIENIPVGIYRTTPEGEIILVNQALCKMLGYKSVEQVLKLKTFEISYDSAGDRKKFNDSIEQNNEIHDFITQWKTKTGEIKFINEHATCVRDKHGKIIYYDGILEDFTERRNFELKLEEYANELTEMNIAKDKFFSIISHDLRSPLGNFKNVLGLMLSNYEIFDESEKKDLLGELDNMAKNLFGLLENLLNWSKSQTGKMTFSPDFYDLNQIIELSTDVLIPVAYSKKIGMTKTVESNLKVFVDADMLNTVIRNLVSNAIKFTEEGGKILISAFRSNDGFQISVKDTGLGMDEVTIGKLFRLESTHSTKGTANESGSGLGLLLCKELVEKHQGKIWVESKLGSGTTFNFFIPNTKTS